MVSGSGRLVVLDAAGRAGKQFPLASGAATLGRDAACDVRVLKPDVWPQHAIVVVHSRQSVVRSVCAGSTRVNGREVSVAALRHGDVIALGGRSLRWLYDRPPALAHPPALPHLPSPPSAVGSAGRGRGPGPGRGRRASQPAPPRAALHLHHRASMPGSAGGKQVAIVQPQRRDTSENMDSNGAASASSPRGAGGRGGRAPREAQREAPREAQREAPREAHREARSLSLHDTTKATLWIESRKATPRLCARKSTPLRHAGAPRAPRPRVAKIEAPAHVDRMKRAALMLMAGGPRAPRRPASAPAPAPRSATVSILELSDSSARDSTSRRSQPSPPASPLLPSPKKSSLKDPKKSRKTDSIKFDLSNLETRDVSPTDDPARYSSDDDITLHYDDSTSSMTSPSPRRSIHSRGKTGSPMKPQQSENVARKSLRGSILLQNTLGQTDDSHYSRRTTRTLTDHSWDATVESAFKTRTLSPRSARNLETYSVVDLVSSASNDASMYDSVGSTRSSSVMFATPRSMARKTRSTIDPTSVASSTPYVKTRAAKRSHSNPNISRKSSPNKTFKSALSRRSQSLTTPENSEETKKHISINSTRISRSSKTRSRLNDSDLLLINSGFGDTVQESPKTSRRISRLNRSRVSSPSPKKSLNRSLLSSPSPNSSPNRSQISSPSARKGLSTTRFSNQSPQNSPNRSQLSSSSTRKSLSRSQLSSQSPNNSPDRSQLLSLSARTGLSTTRLSSQSPQNSLNRSQPSRPSAGKSLSWSQSMTPSPKNSPNRSQLSPSSKKSLSRSQLSSPSDRKGVSRSPTSPSLLKSLQNSLNAKQTSPRRSRSTLILNITQSSQDEGPTTPENEYIPEEAGTPVLSIQSLLDSSQSSFTSHRSPQQTRSSTKRKTIGVIRSAKRTRPSIKSKSFTTSVRKSLRSLRLSPSVSQDEENVTPKSGVKLVPEGVKNKHSTSRKPQSKRSIIDNLNESDIVKQLFNSPVKRKLSQSMTEFSRNKLFEDDDVVVSRPTRHTVALGRTPDSTILNQTGRITPEHFVSPLSSPSDSPNFSGIIRRKTTPDGLTGGVKSSRRSTRNDLTVTGIKSVFAKSPRNDLRRVTGVKTLFRSNKKQKSPKNDLSDVRGVRNLFTRRSARNDLRNVSGVKTILRKSPKNDLRDVRGVRNLFRQEKQSNYHDVSGVEELFNESNTRKDAEALFDQLIGKPPIKAVYSKSFVAKRPMKRKRANRSLRKSVDEITNNVEEWLEKELQKCLHKGKESKGNVSRELQKLATDTVEGSEPMRSSRIRTSVQNVSERQRSASEVYSAHTLPIKKRSLTKHSLDKTRGLNVLPIKKRVVVHSTPVKGRYDMTMNASELGRVSPIAAMDRTEIVDAPPLNRSKQQARPSPKLKGKGVAKASIVEETEEAIETPQEAVEETGSRPRGRRTKASEEAKKAITTSPKPKRSTRARNVNGNETAPKATRASKSDKNVKSNDTAATTLNHEETNAKTSSPKPRRGRGKASTVVIVTENETRSRRTRNTAKVSEEKPKGRKAKQIEDKEQSVVKPSPKRTRGSRKPASPVRKVIPKADSTAVANTKKRRASLVISKKAPAMSPKPTRATRGNPKISVESPKNATRRPKATPTVNKPKSPRQTRAKLIVGKPSPRLKPRGANVSSESKSPQKTVETKRGGRKNAGPSSSRSDNKSPQKPVETKRGRRQNADTTRAGSKTAGSSQSPPKAIPTKRRRNANTTKAESQTGQKKAEPSKSEPSPPVKRGRRAAKPETIEPEPPVKRGRAAKSTISEVPPSPKQLRGKKAQETHNAKAAVVPIDTRRGRKRKSMNDHSAVPAKVAKIDSPSPKGKKTGARPKAKNVTIVAPQSEKQEAARSRRGANVPASTSRETVKAQAQVENKPAERKAKGKAMKSIAESGARPTRSKAAASPAKATTRSRRR